MVKKTVKCLNHDYKELLTPRLICRKCGKVILYRTRFDEIIGDYIVIDEKGKPIGR